MIDVACPRCGEVYHADPVHVGKRIKCGKCGSLLPILDGKDTIVQQPLGTSNIQTPRPRAEHGSARHSSHRDVFRSGFTFLVATVAVGLLILWWHSTRHEDAKREFPAKTGTSQTSSEPVAGDEPLTTGSDGSNCAGRASAEYRSLPNGTRIKPDVGTNGYGVLEVQNGTSDDAVLSLYDPADDEAVREVYVQAGHSVRVKGIPRGSYELAYTRGFDWTSEDSFRCGDPDYAEFERQFVFTEERDQEGIQYKTITVTLHPVIGGNVRTSRISRAEFLRGHRNTAALSRQPSR